MKDQYNREIDYLRVSVTDRCNLRCVYCMPEEGVEPVAHEEILSYEEILRVCRCAAKLGFWRVKLTGGEPLVRRGVAGLAREIKAIPGIRQVTMTTNGVLLGDYAEELAAALQNCGAVAVMDKCAGFSAAGGPLFAEVCAALYGAAPRPLLVSYTYGLGGRDVTVDSMERVFGELEETLRTGAAAEPCRWLDVRG